MQRILLLSFIVLTTLFGSGCGNRRTQQTLTRPAATDVGAWNRPFSNLETTPATTIQSAASP